MLKQITPVILTFNEEANIARTLEGLSWVDEIVVVDSFSDDATLHVVAEFPRARIVQRPFDSHARQWNYAISETGISTDWMLALDADYRVTKQFVEELSRLSPNGSCNGYAADFVYCVDGRPLRAALYPRVTVLFRRGGAHYVQAGHTQRLEIQGAVGRLKAKLLHDDRKSLSRWFSSQRRYARLEAEHLVVRPGHELRSVDRLRAAAWPAPLLVFVYTLLVKGYILNGWPVWRYTLQRTLVDIMIALEVIDLRFRNSSR